MRRLVLSLAVAIGAMFSVAGIAAAATADQEAAFVAAYKTAFEAKDAAALQALLYSGGDPMAMDFYGQMMTAEMADGTLTSIELKDLSPDDVAAAATVQDMPSGKMQLLPKPYKKLVLKIDTKTADTTASSNSEVYVAEDGGKIVIAVPAPAK
ncbi:MAG: hypothetical protein WDM94_06485 [Bauldia sp.]